MELKLFFGFASSIFAFISYLPYIRDIIKHKTEPHSYSWLIWTILQTLGVITLLKEGAGYGTWALGISAMFCFIIFALSLKYSTKNISAFDGVCLFASLCTIVMYIIIKNPIWTIVAISLIDFIGFLPTYRKAYEEPFTETISTFLLSAVANALGVLAVEHYTLTTLLYIISLFFTNSFLVILVLSRRGVLKKDSTL